ncbi:hypothetical protein K3758_02455 [Sulfitobacter sp. W002]|uniref:hypothetical protein n=1 Tax=Sulfitobacter sp. W002 TaxID=2867024 RepID=UPI0021A5FEC2|nr:hypothetical protein [Sulfitobacter sp. W002]UWR30412.1 hypothetical protein K3758_02455 [Sulfitobacter sp. W002]
MTNFTTTVTEMVDDSDHALLKAARELGCNDPLVQSLADRIEALRGGMSAIGMSPSLSSCHLIATQSLKGH